MKISDFFASHGGQFLSIYILTLVAMGFSLLDHETGKTILNLALGALLRDMQDPKITSYLPGQKVS